MSRFKTEADLEKIVKRTLMAFLSEADFSVADKVKPSKPKAGKFPAEAELLKALRVHYEDYEGSELAEASREKFNGKANLRCCMLTWGILHKQPSVKEFVGNKKSKALRTNWWNIKK